MMIMICIITQSKIVSLSSVAAFVDYDDGVERVWSGGKKLRNPVSIVAQKAIDELKMKRLPSRYHLEASFVFFSLPPGSSIETRIQSSVFKKSFQVLKRSFFY